MENQSVIPMEKPNLRTSRYFHPNSTLTNVPDAQASWAFLQASIRPLDKVVTQLMPGVFQPAFHGVSAGAA